LRRIRNVSEIKLTFKLGKSENTLSDKAPSQLVRCVKN